jgi:hypothetical protein
MQEECAEHYQTVKKNTSREKKSQIRRNEIAKKCQNRTLILEDERSSTLSRERKTFCS